MTAFAIQGRLLLAIAAAGILAACSDLARPGAELWPTTPYEPTEGMRMADVETTEGPDGSYFQTGTYQGRSVYVVGNRTDAPLIVFLQDPGGNGQQITVPPRGTVPVAFVPDRIVGARPAP